MLDRIQLQEVPPYVASSNGEQERRHSELLSQSRHAFDGQVYMVYEDPLRLQQSLVTLVPNPSTTSLVSISAVLIGSFANCSVSILGCREVGFYCDTWGKH